MCVVRTFAHMHDAVCASVRVEYVSYAYVNKLLWLDANDRQEPLLPSGGVEPRQIKQNGARRRKSGVRVRNPAVMPYTGGYGVLPYRRGSQRLRVRVGYGTGPYRKR
jgi:hypothetical protein